jgi:hypothetical protein
MVFTVWQLKAISEGNLKLRANLRFVLQALYNFAFTGIESLIKYQILPTMVIRSIIHL